MPVSRIKAWPDFFGHGPFSIIFKVLRAASFIPRGRGVPIFLKNGILGGAFYKYFEWGM
jgi:hypothetical protein